MGYILKNADELIRFVLTGGMATVANMLVVWLVRAHLTASSAIAVGLVTGMAVSFILMKMFAFRSSDWSGAHGELVRFLMVYAFGTVIYFFVALMVESMLTGLDTPSRLAAVGGVFAGGLVMAVTSYFGHRHFTYRHARGDRAR